jgi:hypothetical protein
MLTPLFIGPNATHAEYVFNFQGASVATAKNDVQIPGDTGTRFSLSDDLHAERAFSWRVEAGYIFGGRDYVGFMVSPLTVTSQGRMARDVLFAGSTFPAGTDLTAKFRFDSYRLTWRRKLVAKDTIDIWLGLTGKVRDAAISLEGNGTKAEKKNTGFVPLVNFYGEWRFANPWSLRIAGDALGASQGRAEDVLVAVTYALSDTARILAGYRILEGGADNDEVYTFSLFHYIVGGVEVRF